MSDEEVEFIDADSDFRTQKSNSFKDIIMNHMSKISNICTKEFRPGYWKKKPVVTAGGVYMSETYEEDTREAYINAVDFLHDIMLPKMDEEAKKAINEVITALNGKKDKLETKDEWRDEKLVARREIFRQLSLLLKRIDYLESGSIED